MAVCTDHVTLCDLGQEHLLVYTEEQGHVEKLLLWVSMVEVHHYRRETLAASRTRGGFEGIQQRTATCPELPGGLPENPPAGLSLPVVVDVCLDVFRTARRNAVRAYGVGLTPPQRCDPPLLQLFRSHSGDNLAPACPNGYLAPCIPSPVPLPPGLITSRNLLFVHGADIAGRLYWATSLMEFFISRKEHRATPSPRPAPRGGRVPAGTGPANGRLEPNPKKVFVLSLVDSSLCVKVTQTLRTMREGHAKLATFAHLLRDGHATNFRSFQHSGIRSLEFT